MREPSEGHRIAMAMVRQWIAGSDVATAYINSFRVCPDEPDEEDADGASDVLEGEVIGSETVHPISRRIGNGQ